MSGRNRVPVARIAKSFGLSGELLIGLYDVFPDDFDMKEPLFVEIDGLAVPLFCDRFERRGKRGALAVFSDFHSERRVSGLLGRELLLPAGAPDTFEDAGAPDEEVVYLEDLVGLKAVVDDRLEGTIDDFIDGENPLFLLSLGGREVYVPAVDEFIVETDLDEGVIRFEVPDGLLGLND